ncbi:MAG TPA: dolichyl-phosphate beta-glucosyltransferase [Candidatus Acidoferrales bacterium]|jgi:dolichyl-phosphate beta-glucosyltransferase|nr:dolichyl-phosphate beta-glucosyltransferase [Candidatus Acidoferrales bacterium]
MPEFVSIIIPAYNESDRIGRTLEQVFAYLEEQQLNAEVIVVDDGSRDNTAEVVNGFAAHHPNLRVLHNPGNRGKGYSVRNGMLNARGDILLFTDADLSSPIEEAPKLFEALANGSEVAFGSRWVETELQTEPQPILRRIAGRLYNILLRVFLGLHYEDTQCGFKAFNRRAAEVVFTRQRIERWGFDPELLFIARKFGLRLTEVPVKWAHDDRSKINPLLDGIKMFGEMLSIRWWSLTGRYRNPEFEFAPAEPGTVLNAQRR